jgi:hypothetical protein
MLFMHLLLEEVASCISRPTSRKECGIRLGIVQDLQLLFETFLCVVDENLMDQSTRTYNLQLLYYVSLMLLDLQQ